MAHFNYTATTTDGKETLKKGQLAANDAEDAENKVRAMFSQPVTVTVTALGPMEVPYADRQLMGRGATPESPVRRR